MKLVNVSNYKGNTSDYCKLVVKHNRARYHITYDFLTKNVNIREWYDLREEELKQMEDFTRASVSEL